MWWRSEQASKERRRRRPFATVPPCGPRRRVDWRVAADSLAVQSNLNAPVNDHDGRVGLTSVGNTPEDADRGYREAERVLLAEAAAAAVPIGGQAIGSSGP